MDFAAADTRDRTRHALMCVNLNTLPARHILNLALKIIAAVSITFYLKFCAGKQYTLFFVQIGFTDKPKLHSKGTKISLDPIHSNAHLYKGFIVTLIII